METNLPRDPVMLLSVINTKLRDYYPTLDRLCEEMHLSKKELTDTLSQIDYVYDAEQNRFL